MALMTNYWENRRVFVTGATGMIGSWLIDELVKKRAHVVALVRDFDPRSELFRSGNIDQISVVSGTLEELKTIERAINEFEIAVVFHLGAQAIVSAAQRDPIQAFESNIRGTYNLLEACRRYPHSVRRVVVASSDKAYGEVANLPYTEDMALQGRNPYEVSKSCADLIAQSYHQAYDLPVAISRCANTYGGGDLNWSRIIPGAISAFLSGDSFSIRSDGSYLRDYMYVADSVNAYLCLGEADDRVHGQAFNFSTESPITVLDLVKTIRSRMDRATLEPVVLGTATGEIHDQYLSSKKARDVLGWSGDFALVDGIDSTVEWYKDYFKISG
jgi:CDP-glucose 4,6-dehydratase